VVGGEEKYVAQKDAWRAYVELALGLTDTSRKKAMKIVQQVAGKGGATADQLQELVNQGMANREAMVRMIRVEIDRALGRVGLATIDEVDELNRRLRELETELRLAKATPADAVAPVVAAATTPPPAAAKKTVAKKAAKTTASSIASAAPAARKTASARPTGAAKKTTAGGAPAKKVVGPGTPTAGPAARKATARKAATKTTPARKAAAKTSSTGAGVSGAATGGSNASGGRG
jgi:hypothetical protein